MSLIARAALALLVGLGGLVLVATADSVVLDVLGVAVALAGWAVYWVLTFRLILARVRGR